MNYAQINKSSGYEHYLKSLINGYFECLNAFAYPFLRQGAMYNAFSDVRLFLFMSNVVSVLFLLVFCNKY